MNWTQADLDAAKAAYLKALTTGKSVTFGDRSWTSHDLPQLRQLIAEIERSVGAPRPKQFLGYHRGKGL